MSKVPADPASTSDDDREAARARVVTLRGRDAARAAAAADEGATESSESDRFEMQPIPRIRTESVLDI